MPGALHFVMMQREAGLVAFDRKLTSVEKQNNEEISQSVLLVANATESIRQAGRSCARAEGQRVPGGCPPELSPDGRITPALASGQLREENEGAWCLAYAECRCWSCCISSLIVCGPCSAGC